MKDTLCWTAEESDKGKFDRRRGNRGSSVPKRLLLKQCQQAVVERDKTDPGKVDIRGEKQLDIH